MERSIWVVRGGDNNMIVEDCKAKSVVAIGWPAMGDVGSVSSRDEMKERYRKAYKDENIDRIRVQGGQVYRFVHEIKQGDIILLPIKETREVLIGDIMGDYEFNPGVISERYPNVREVAWKHRVSRDDFSVALRSSIGSTLTVFNLNPHAAEIKQLYAGEKPKPPEEEEAEEEERFFEDTKEKAEERIRDIFAHVDPYNFQELVAAVLRAAGLRTIVSPRGPDGGVDILAHPDALGLESPRIKVEVKRQNRQIGSQEMRSFIATIKPDEKGLYVSMGGFTRDAKNEAMHASVTLTLVDGERFAELLTEFYENLDPEFKSMIPLKKVYIPVKLDA